MHRRTPITLLAIFALAVAALPATADDMGGAGFTVPQNEWLWGVEGLVRTPVDLSVDLGVMFVGYDVNGRAVHDDTVDGNGINAVSDTLEIEPETLDGGFRIAGGIGYWNCCVLIEPALSFRLNRGFGDERTDDTPLAFDPGNTPFEYHFAEVEYKKGWDVAVGPQMTWMIRDDTPLLGGILGGLPLVFFPYLGVAHTDWEAELHFVDIGGNDNGVFDRNYEDDNFMVGFDLDIPLPGSHWDFTHAVTFGFRWTDSSGSDDHDFGPFSRDLINSPPPALPAGNGAGGGAGVGCTGGGNDAACFNIDGAKGWRVGLSYRVTWNDFGGFFKRVVFGPVN